MSLKQMAGFKMDCQELIKKFIATNSLKFEDFAAIWRDMHFSFIFFGQRPLGLMRQFTEDALILAKHYWLRSENLSESIAGLYLMYGLYLKHRLPGIIRIPITLDETILINNFAKNFTDSPDSDPAIALQKLFDREAFHLSASIITYGLERQYKLQSSHENNLPNLETFQNDFSPLAEFIPVYNQYVESKREIAHIIGDISLSKTLISEISPDSVCIAGPSKNAASLPTRSPENKRKKKSTEEDDGECSRDFSVPGVSNGNSYNIVTCKEQFVNLPSTSGESDVSENRNTKQNCAEVKSGCAKESVRLKGEISDMLKTLHSVSSSESVEKLNSKTRQGAEFSWIFREDDDYDDGDGGDEFECD